MELMECKRFQHEQYGVVEEGEEKDIQEIPLERHITRQRRHVVLVLIALQGNAYKEDTPPGQRHACGGIDTEGVVKRIDGDARKKGEAVKDEIGHAHRKQ